MKGIKTLRLSYISIWIITGLIAFCSEKEWLPVEYLPHNPNADYAIGLISIVSAIGGTYLALRLLAFKSFVGKLLDRDEAVAWHLFCQWSYARLVILAVAMWTNVVLYYGSAYYESIKYDLLIVMIAAVFCWPSVGEFQNKRKSLTK